MVGVWENADQSHQKQIWESPIWVDLSDGWKWSSQGSCVTRASFEVRPSEPLWKKTNLVLLRQECGVERRNELQEAEHAKKFIIAAWFRSNYHFVSKAVSKLACSSQMKASVNPDKCLHTCACKVWQQETSRYVCFTFLIFTWILKLKSIKYKVNGVTVFDLKTHEDPLRKTQGYQRPGNDLDTIILLLCVTCVSGLLIFFYFFFILK